MIVDEALLLARSRVDRRRTRRVDPFESRRSALGRDQRPGFAARIGGPGFRSALPAKRSLDRKHVTWRLDGHEQRLAVGRERRAGELGLARQLVAGEEERLAAVG